jgi:pimeloyl-ACP methyl ester carboxylesterase
LASVISARSQDARAQDLAGDWQGTLAAGGAELRLVLHIGKASDGTLKATLDSLDQHANGIPVNSISLKNSQLNLGIDAVHGTYWGKVSRDGNRIDGTWSQGQPLPLEFKRMAQPEPRPVAPSDIDGAWMGTLDTGAIQLRVVFHIANTVDGLTATLDSLDQGVKGMPVTSVTRDAAALKMEVKSIAGGFEGRIAPDRSSITGNWTQGGGSIPLLLKPVKDEAALEPRRPQNPVKPYPYREEEVTYENRAQNVTLAATLTLPQGKGPFPAVVLITGSGPQDRDESLMGHKPFLVLSDDLTRRGIAVLRADDRGTGKSTGVFAAATTADFATDTEAGIAYLETRREIDLHRIGLIGHSEGAIVAPMIAARDKDVAFIVMMAGSGVPGNEILVAQLEAIEEASGKSHEEATKDGIRERQLLNIVESEKDPAALEQKLKTKMTGEMPKEQIDAEIKVLTSPWFRYFMTYDPAPALRKVKCPVLAIGGSKDRQVPPQQNLPAIRRALEEGGNQHFAVKELPGLNHLFQTATTGAPSEYAQIEETISPLALETISSWILKQ